jgi:arsenate reductase
MLRILFACVANSCRSQMAEAFCRELGKDVECSSAGSHPGFGVHPDAVRVMAELGIDISGQQVKGLAGLKGQRFDLFVSMGCAEACSYWTGAEELRWDIPDGCGGSVEEVRKVRDMIRERVSELLRQHGCLEGQ